jgi:hypothetical protein
MVVRTKKLKNGVKRDERIKGGKPGKIMFLLPMQPLLFAKIRSKIKRFET